MSRHTRKMVGKYFYPTLFFFLFVSGKNFMNKRNSQTMVWEICYGFFSLLSLSKIFILSWQLAKKGVCPVSVRWGVLTAISTGDVKIRCEGWKWSSFYSWLASAFLRKICEGNCSFILVCALFQTVSCKWVG